MSDVIDRARQAALEPYTDAPTSTEEWLRAIELGAEAAMVVLLEHFLSLPIWTTDSPIGSMMQEIRRLLEEVRP